LSSTPAINCVAELSSNQHKQEQLFIHQLSSEEKLCSENGFQECFIHCPSALPQPPFLFHGQRPHPNLCQVPGIARLRQHFAAPFQTCQQLLPPHRWSCGP